MGKKAKHKALPQDRRLAKARAAAGAAATAGRARTFANKHDKLAANKGDAEIDAGIEEYKEKSKNMPLLELHHGASINLTNAEMLEDVFAGLSSFYPGLKHLTTKIAVAKKVNFPDSGNKQQDYENIRDQVEKIIGKAPASPDKPLTLTVTIHGTKLGDIELALEEVKRLVSEGNTSGGNSNDSGDYSFDMSGEEA